MWYNTKFVDLVSTFSSVLKAAAFSLEVMDWFERFPRGLLRGVSLCYLLLEEGVFSVPARNHLLNTALGTPRPRLTLPSWLRAFSPVSGCTSWGEHYTDAFILHLQRQNVS